MPRIITRLSLATCVLVAIGAADAGHDARAGYTSAAQWCVRAYDGADECFYLTWSQCHAAVWGTGGSCVLNPHFTGGPPPYRKARRGYR